jgi:hypothetical protein
MGQKILYGARKVDGKNVLIGGHSAKILDNPNFAAEVLSTNADGTTLHRGVVNGVQVEVMKIGDAVTSGYPTGGGVTGLLSGFE